MQANLRRSVIPLALGVLAFVLALAQRPGLAASDTKVDLHVDPVGFLADIFAVWSPTGSTGHVQGGQYAGYLFPMGPFFAVGRLLGLSPWLTQRIWLGLLLALAAWGMVVLLDETLSPVRGWGHLVAGLMVILNAYVVTLANRTSVTLLALAALPWLLVCVHRGLRNSKGWAAPICFAILVGASGGGVNAAVTAWMLVGPALLAAYELLIAAARPRDLWRFAARALPLTAALSLWWIVPVMVQAGYGTDLLAFTEQPGTIWHTPSLIESLRMMGYWVSYVGVGFTGVREPYYSTASAYLFFAPVVVASLLAATLPILGLVWTRRNLYGPFFGLMVIIGAVIMSAGWPDGTPLRDASYFVYNRLGAIQFLRTTYKAGPLVAVGLAGLGGFGVAKLASWIRQLPGRRSLAIGVASAAAVAGTIVLAAWPLASGRAIDRNVTWKEVPAYWRQTAKSLDHDLPRNERAIVLPGSLYSFYRWGGTVDPILPALTQKPVATRSYVPLTDSRATDLLWTVDGLVQQQRVQPGQLTALLRLMSVGRLISSTDAERGKAGVTSPLDAQWALGADGKLVRGPWFGAKRVYTASGTGLAVPENLPDVQSYAIKGSRGLVSVLPRDPQTIVDGSAESLAALAGLGRLPDRQAIFYAADRSATEVRDAARLGAHLVVADGNKRRAAVPARLRQNTGWLLGPRDDVSVDGLRVDPFPQLGTRAQTVAYYGRSVESVFAPFSPGGPQFPEHRPFMAVDGREATAWRSDGVLETERRYVDISFVSPRNIPYVDVLPYNDSRATVRAISVNGKTQRVHSGWTRVALPDPRVERLRVGLADVQTPKSGGGGGGIREVRIPGVRIRESLRLPRLVESALSGDVGPAAEGSNTKLSYLLTRTTADDPYRRKAASKPVKLLNSQERQDPEYALHREIRPPFPAAWRPSGLGTISARTPDGWIDRAVGMTDTFSAESSGRFLGRPGWRASMAFDGSDKTAWIGTAPAGSDPWISWRTRSPLKVASISIRPVGKGIPAPRRVRLVVDGSPSLPVDVASGGRVDLSEPLRGSSFRLEILTDQARGGAARAAGRPAAVGISEIKAPGFPRVDARLRGTFRSGCDAALVTAASGRTRVNMRIRGLVDRLDRGLPVALVPCADKDRLVMPSGPVTVAGRPKRAVVESLILDSPSASRPAEVRGGGKLVDPGIQGRGSWSNVRLRVDGPSWLALGETWNKGWRATCNGRDLGPPTPINGYANGWPVGKGCSKVGISFKPMVAVRASYLVSAVVLVCSLLVLAALFVRRRERRALRCAPQPCLPEEPVGRMPAARSAVLGLMAGSLAGFVFGIRAGVVVAPIGFIVFWLGIRDRTLFLLCGLLLTAVVPAIYLILPVANDGGYSFDYPTDLVAAHWVAVLAVSLAALGLARAIAFVRRRWPPS